jgi:hypothetical protein
MLKSFIGVKRGTWMEKFKATGADVRVLNWAGRSFVKLGPDRIFN